MFRFKVGDKVRIKSLEQIKPTLDGPLSTQLRTGGPLAIEGNGPHFQLVMAEYCGRSATISSITEFRGSARYFMDSEIGFCWNETWLEPVYPELPDDLFIIEV